MHHCRIWWEPALICAVCQMVGDINYDRYLEMDISTLPALPSTLLAPFKLEGLMRSKYCGLTTV